MVTLPCRFPFPVSAELSINCSRLLRQLWYPGREGPGASDMASGAARPAGEPGRARAGAPVAKTAHGRRGDAQPARTVSVYSHTVSFVAVRFVIVSM